MQKEGIGTKATRAGIVQTLYDRKYIKERNIEVTELGLEVIDVLVTSCPVVTSAKLTRSLEEKMTEIQHGETTREEVIRGVIGSLGPIMEDLRDREQEIGKQLSQALGAARFERKDIGVCPICKTGRLLAVRSKKTGKRFLGCTQYFEGNCRASFPLPQQGLVRSSGSCALCGWPRIQISKRGKNSWNFCFNPHCVGKKAGLK
jgi:DNA topoisomerase-1